MASELADFRIQLNHAGVFQQAFELVFTVARPVIVQQSVFVTGILPGIVRIVYHGFHVCIIFINLVKSFLAAEEDDVEPRT